MTKLHIAKDLALPLGVVTERLAFVGMSGGGKTYAAMKLAELFLEVGAQVVVLDPVGPWWGLRAGADGKSPGFPIHVFGGIHGDLPLVHTAGALVADLLVEKGVSAVLDVSDFTGGQMATFVSDFAERFFDRKKRSPTPMHLFLEEAHFFIPQILQPGERGDKAGVMMGRVDRIVRVGRNYGIGSSIISQQPQSVKKTALNQSRTIFAFASGGKHERTAIIDWFGSNTRADNDAIFDLLRQLENGVAYFASTWLKVEGRQVDVAQKKTFDSSKTPQFGEVLPKPKVLAPVDVDAVKGAMAEVQRQAEQDDPRPLRRRIVELERELAKKPAAAAPTPAKVQRVEVPVLKDGQIRRLDRAIDRLSKHMLPAADTLHDLAANVMISAKQLTVALHGLRGWDAQAAGLPAPPPRAAAPAPVPRRPLPPPAPPRAAPGRPAAGGAPSEIGNGGLRRMLVALAQRPQGLTDRQLGIRAGISSRSGSYRNYRAKARGQGWITGSGVLKITEGGVAAVGTYEPLPGGAGLAAYWLGELGNSGAARMLSALLEVYPAALSDEALGERAGISHLSGSFRNYRAKLRSLELITGRGELLAAEELFA